MELGIVGKPNVGKSTFFTAATLAPAEIQNYPFTTIKANKGVGTVKVQCPEKDFGLSCSPRTGECKDAIRYIPVEIIDVAGLVPDAHIGKGLGNKFLDDLRQASALIHVIDASGGTDFEGNPTEGHDPVKDVEFLDKEVSHWIKNIYLKGWDKRSRQVHMSGDKVERAIAEKLTGLGISELKVLEALRRTDLPDNILNWTDEDQLDLAREIRKIGKPMIIAANKADVAPKENVDALRTLESEGYLVIPTCAEFELALKRAAKAGMIDYMPGGTEFSLVDDSKLNKAQKGALDKIADWMKEYGSTGVQDCLEKGIFGLLDLIAVFPVEDEAKLTDKDGRVLPDAYLVPNGITAKEVAFKVHSDIGEGFIRAINARTKRIIGADYKIENLDVIKIISSK